MAATIQPVNSIGDLTVGGDAAASASLEARVSSVTNEQLGHSQPCTAPLASSEGDVPLARGSL